MAIYGMLNDTLKMENLNSGIKKGLQFLKEAELENIFTGIEKGKSNVIEIEGRDLFVVFSSYEIKDDTSPTFEGHRKYIDIQYVIEGEELILVTSDNVTNIGEYDENNDCQLCESELYSSFLMIPGYVSVLFPEDWHSPGRKNHKISKVKKVVVKVAIDRN